MADHDKIVKREGSDGDTDAPTIPTPGPDSKEGGILSRTLIRSPSIHTILPGKIRTRHQNDVIFVGDNFIQVLELGRNGYLEDTAVKTDFGSKILAANVIGLSENEVEEFADSVVKQEHDSTDGCMDWTKDRACEVPPQLLVLVLESQQVLFIYCRDNSEGSVDFYIRTRALPRELSSLPQYGQHLAVDPQSRAIAIAAPFGHVGIMSLKSADALTQESQSGETKPIMPVTEERFFRTDGIILQVNFLLPPPDRPDSAILLLLVSKGGSTRIVLYEWDTKLGLRHNNSLVGCSGQILEATDSAPLMLIPSALSTSFMLKLILSTTLGAMGPASTKHPKARLFACSGRGEGYGAVAELRHGLEAKIGLIIDQEDGISMNNIWILPDFHRNQITLLAAHPLYSTALTIDAASLEIEVLEDGSEYGFSLSSTTVAAGFLQPSTFCQVTRSDIIVCLLAPNVVYHQRFGIGERISFAKLTTAGHLPVAITVSQEAVSSKYKLAARTFRYDSAAHIQQELNATFDLDFEPTSLAIHGGQSRLLVCIGTADGTVLLFLFDGLTIVRLDKRIHIDASNEKELCPLDSLEVIESIDPSTSASSSSLSFVILAGSRNGVLFSTNMSFTDLDVPGNLDLGLTKRRKLSNISITLDGDPSNPSSAFINDGKGLKRISLNPRLQHGQYSIHDVWFTDQNNPCLNNPHIHALARVPSLAGWTSQSLEKALVIVTDDSLLISTCGSRAQAVPRRLPVKGNPLRIAYLEHMHKLVVGVELRTITEQRTRATRPGIEIIDIDPLASKQCPAEPYLKGKVGERITCITHWKPKTKDKTYAMIVIGTSVERSDPLSCDGRVIFATADGGPQGTKVKHKRTYKFADKPVYSLAAFGDNSLVIGLGESLLLQSLDFASRRWQRKAEYQLPSPALHITVAAGQVLVTTARHSLLCFAIVDDHWTRVANDQQARTGISHAVLANGPVLATLSAGGGAVVGLERDSPGRLRPVFEAHLSHNVTRLSNASDRSSLPYSHECLFGSTADGVVYHFTKLSNIEWRLLYFVQSLHNQAQGSRTRWPASLNKHGLLERSSLRPSEKHIDGDFLDEILAKGRGHLQGLLWNSGSIESLSKQEGISAVEDRLCYFSSLVKECTGISGDPAIAFITWIHELLVLGQWTLELHTVRICTEYYLSSWTFRRKASVKMAPKKKGGKKAQNDDWENELGEVPDSAPQDANSSTAQDDDAATEVNPEEEFGGGGLLAALKKNKTKKAKKGKPTQEFVEGEDPTSGAATPPATDLNGKAPEEATFEEDDVFAGTAKKGKGGNKPAQDADVDTEETGGMKSKKEKEKEKKEREKQRKKEQAAKKKATAPAQVAKPDAPKTVETVATPAPAVENIAASAGKKKKVPAHLAALQRQQEALARQREEEARLAQLEKEEAEALRKQEEEEEKKREEARQRKKEKEKERKEQLRKEGKLLSEAEKKRKAQQELRMKQLLAAGVKVAGLEEAGEEKKKPVFDRKKKAPKKQEEEDLEAAAERARAQAQAAEEERQRLAKEVEEKRLAEEAAAAKAQESELEDWEAAADKDEDIKDSWDADSDEEAAGKANGTTVETTVEKPKSVIAKMQAGSESESDSEEDSSDEEVTATERAAAQRKAEAAARREKAHQEALAARSKDNLRSPICCILGHVDTGKTKLLDKIRQTNVQEGEAGGITQQIGATYFPTEALKQKTQVVNQDGKFEFKVPGLLVIDTPGHESFSNLRSRGSSLCNIAILVVDIMHGLEPQTLESMRLLRDRKTPFIVALNKIDRLYGWKQIANNGFQESLAMQSKGTQAEFRDRLEKTKLAFAEQGFNSELYYENKSMARYVSLVPTSAHTGEGIPDMLKLLLTLTQERMTSSLMYLSEVECTVLEVKVIEGLGTTIDVVLSNGVLREGDRIVLCGLNGAICTNIRALLTPAPLKELRLKSQYVHNKEVKAAMGIKIAANDLEGAIAGSRLLVVSSEDDEEDLEEEVMSDLENLLSKVSKDQRGVSVQASTLGSLEALLEFLRVSKIPVANISIGPVYKRDVMMAGTMLEKAKEYAVMLCFDVKVDKDAQAYADDVGVKIFTADIIYHLFDDFTNHMAKLLEQKKEESKLLAVWPCVLSPVAVFNKKDPIVMGVDVVEGQLKLLTPVAAVRNNPVTGVKEVINLGRISSIERDHKAIQVCKKGQPSVAIKIEGPNQPLYGRQLDETETLYSLISRASIDTLKQYYRSEVSNEEWLLISKKLKPLFDIP
ncbi:putative mitochondrial translation initiation factor if [Phaeomoniella chlamydospora]|uniref:Eukaryotic translation initiation factor 5B n=1 Tax=Phaeomoniella chlamydospora TaxID=158046 RepID=A0A0G2GJA1_PHACM|nr:putative mitochondrial translation initiation factor if [Phaeomoniella chlamydospora]